VLHLFVAFILGVLKNPVDRNKIIIIRQAMSKQEVQKRVLEATVRHINRSRKKIK
jgi:hypothetical protein